MKEPQALAQRTAASVSSITPLTHGNHDLEAFQPLVKYEGQSVGRPDHLATISAGYKGSNGAPVISRDGTIYLSDPEGRAPALASILKASNGRTLRIAMPTNNPADFIGQAYRKEGRARLEAYGDAKGITTIGENSARVFYPAGTEGFDRLKSECKVTINITFLLADYNAAGQPNLIFPDGLGAYRLRTTSQQTLNNLLSALKRIASFTGGHFAGFPLETSLVYRNVADSTGAKRSVPVFVFTLKPPSTITLDSRTFGAIAQGAQLAISMSMLELPDASPTLDAEVLEFDTPREGDIKAMGTGINPEQARRAFFAIAGQKSGLSTPQGRAEFISRYTDKRTNSLKAFLLDATPESVEAFLKAAEEAVNGIEDPGAAFDPPVPGSSYEMAISEATLMDPDEEIPF